MTFEKKEETVKKLSNVLHDSIFPVNVDINNLKDHLIYKGLTKREYFAAMAMQGYISCGKANVMSCESLAIYSVQAADALIAELNK